MGMAVVTSGLDECSGLLWCFMYAEEVLFFLDRGIALVYALELGQDKEDGQKNENLSFHEPKINNALKASRGCSPDDRPGPVPLVGDFGTRVRVQ